MHTLKLATIKVYLHPINVAKGLRKMVAGEQGRRNLPIIFNGLNQYSENDVGDTSKIWWSINVCTQWKDQSWCWFFSFFFFLLGGLYRYSCVCACMVLCVFFVWIGCKSNRFVTNSLLLFHKLRSYCLPTVTYKLSFGFQSIDVLWVLWNKINGCPKGRDVKRNKFGENKS